MKEFWRRLRQKPIYLGILAAIILLAGLGLAGRLSPAKEENLATLPTGAAESSLVAFNDATANPPADATTEASPVSVRKPELLDYTVQAGDNLWNIARDHHIAVSTLTAVNNLSETSVLQIGQTIKILTVDGAVHKVAAGDTIGAIAKKYGVTEEVILTNNPVDPQSLPAGTLLLLPGGKVPTPAVSTRPSTKTASRGSGTTFAWPVRGRISSSYGWRTHPISGKRDFHEGMDIAAPTGTAIVAAADGTVTYAGWMGGYGFTVVVKHNSGLETQYSHNSANLVSVGQKVKRGQKIAKVGETGVATGPHLHLNVMLNGEYVNPAKYLR